MKHLFLGLCGLTILAPTRAWALSFDAAGVASFDPKAVQTESFEAIAAQPGLVIKDGADALLGGRYAIITATNGATVDLPITVPADKGAYRARFFARTNRVVADVAVDYPEDGGSPSFTARFFPTGRVTSDGWYEVTTSRFSIDGARTPTAKLSIFASGAGVDAFELVRDGDFKALNKCALPADPACGAGELCAAGWCRNGEANVPPLPQGASREDLVSYLEGRLTSFFGGRITREARLPVAKKTLAAMRTAPDAWAFWNGYATAIHQLHDWHTKIDGPVAVSGRGAFPICFVEGDADLTHDAWPKDAALPDVLVSHVGPEGASGLKPGDRIVAINGMHPIAFAESLEAIDWDAWRSNDPEGHAEAVERLRFMVRRWADTITVIRCDAATHTCKPPETLHASDLPAAEPSLYPQCDHRPGYHLASGGPDATSHDVSDVSFGPLRESGDGEGLYGVVWDSVYLQEGLANPYTTAIEALRANAKGIVLDHRTGNGGTEPAAEYLTTLFRLPATLGVATGFNGTIGWFDAPFTKADGLSIFDRLVATSEAYTVGAADARTDVRTALLLARDGSASDWFPEGMKGLTNVRSFGRRTAGAFSSFIQFDYFGGMNWQFGSGDYIREDGTTHIGEGVLPDEELLPRQSDLLDGRDTVYERALAWVRSGQ
jgi:hypothetical protein